MSVSVLDLAWPEVAERLQTRGMAIVPIGAGAKQHGPHLPCGTDYIQADYFATRLAEHLDALVWPVVSYGFYPAFVEYPGSVSLDEAIFRSSVAQIVAHLVGAGARAVVIVNTGISTIKALNEICHQYAGAASVIVLNCYAGEHYRAAVDDIEEQAHGGHADEIETAIMLAISPQRVAMSRAVANPTPIRRGRFNRSDATGPNYSPSGVSGDPRLASASKGSRLVEAIVADLIDGATAQG